MSVSILGLNKKLLYRAVLVTGVICLLFTACLNGIPPECYNRGHDFSVFVSTTADCYYGGEETLKCSYCNETKKQPASALSHIWDQEETFIEEPTCVDNGVGAVFCIRNCGTSDIHYDINSLGHILECFTASCRTNCKIYEIGEQGPGTGIIYYVADGQNGRPLGFEVQGFGTLIDYGYFETYTAYYLEAAPNDSNDTQWGSFGNLINGVTTFTLATDDGFTKIGNGRKDTHLIIAHMLGNIITGTAAQMAFSEDFGEKNDWFLPSFEELNQLCINQNHVGNFSPDGYWASTQFNSNIAWGFDFGDSSDGAYNKNNLILVRAIRAF